MVPACAIVMQGRMLNEVEEQLRRERVQRNLERFKEAERNFERQKTVVEG
ncbi:hypothetical protein [Marinococcus halotolerans]|nr:hypothetical protein [Marinococcus halotolerans]